MTARRGPPDGRAEVYFEARIRYLLMVDSGLRSVPGPVEPADKFVEKPGTGW